ncbi:hypothetical protein PCANC_03901 [Puccinia coronata f. sp. avenae]|uniref:histone deacetylase n=1 Tax=Puccinia coronata f. sp. avenae TaxID=200324 RepID=A0A2N5T607_9BASI|nr:hypothetical protein PCANC_08662 [Puccinia coronata f. sp. avenae]PLW56074.1 hypothetical protein PCANC_03901 [Puccinia coronata f. sp. avenae]
MAGNMIPIAGESKKRICYFFDSDIGNYHYGPGHPMKPHRIRMTHALVMNYGLYKKMEIFRAKPATRKEMAQFHTDDYVDFLSKVTPDNMEEFLKEQAKFNLGDDCPVFDGLFEYCSISAGGSMEGAARLSRDKCDIAVNWAGGLHHAKKAEANGFCYVNDIVLGILELLRYHKRVLYVDIDVHHGDGVEEAFYTTDRVMTCSFHKYGEFFPGTGELRDTGHGKGKYYAVNFPLRDGITDEAYKNIFEPVITKIMETYQPSAIVLQCGGDSLSGDRLGSFNVSMRGHANCVRFIKSLGLPLLLLGGGGYTIRNVSRTWAYETGLAAGQELCPDIPMNEYYEYYGPTYRLDVPPSNMEDMNIAKYLEKTKIQIFENLRHTIPVPSVGLQAIPKLPHDEMDIDEDLDNPNERRPQRLLDGLIQRDDEFSDSEDEGEGGRRDIQSHKRARRQSPKMNGNGMLNIYSGIQTSLSQSRQSAELHFNTASSNHDSSLSVDAPDPPVVAPTPIPPLLIWGAFPRPHHLIDPQGMFLRPHYNLIELRPDHLINRPDHLIDRPDYLINRPDYLINRPDHVINRPNHVINRPDHLINRPDHLINRPDHLINRPDHLINRPDHLIDRPDHLINRLEYLINRPHHLIDRPDYLINRLDHQIDRLDYLISRPHYLIDRLDHLIDRSKLVHPIEAVIKS